MKNIEWTKEKKKETEFWNLIFFSACDHYTNKASSVSMRNLTIAIGNQFILTKTETSGTLVPFSSLVGILPGFVDKYYNKMNPIFKN